MSTSDTEKNRDLELLFMKACELQEQKHFDEAENIYRQLLVDLPDIWLIRYNLGLLLFEQKKFPEALTQYQKAVTLTDPNNDLFYNLAICQKECGLINQAIDSYMLALEVNQGDIDSLYNLAGCYTSLDRTVEAIKCYLQVLACNSKHMSTLNNLAYLYHKTGDKKNGLKFYSRLLEIAPGHQAAEHMVAALSGKSKNSAPVSYIRDVFDHYSDHYEESLVNKLHYNLPAKLAKFVVSSTGKSTFHSILDLGCGTGLSGQAFRDFSSTIDGIDLSEKMVALAHEKKIYHNLFVNDIKNGLNGISDCKYDLVIAADVFTYLGELEDIFNGVKNIAATQCSFYFSVEYSTDHSSLFTLRESGRFAHSDKYIRETAITTGWEYVTSKQTELRKERDEWIKGMIYGFIPATIT